MSDDSLTAMYDWDYAKCRQCGGSDFAEIKSEVRTNQMEVVLRCSSWN